MKSNPFWHELKKKNIFTLTASVSFFAFLSIFPFLLLVLSLAGRIIGKTQALAYLGRLLQTLPPSVTETLTRSLEGMLSNSSVLSLVSFLFLVFAAFQMFLQLHIAINHILRIHDPDRKHKIEYWRRHLKLLLFFLAFTLILLLMLVMGSTLPVILSRLKHIPLLGSGIVVEIVLLALEILFFSFSYKWLAERPLSWRSVFVAGGLVAVCWEILKRLFSLYISHLGAYSALYGSIGSIFLLQLWLYYSIFFYLAGASVCMWLNRGPHRDGK